MNDQQNQTDLMAQLAAQLQQLQAASGQTTAPALAGWQSTKPQALAVQGVAVPVSVQTPIGKVRVYFWLGPEAAQSPEALTAALEQMSAAGIPIDAWDSKAGWGGKSGGWNGGSRGGWRR